MKAEILYGNCFFKWIVPENGGAVDWAETSFQPNACLVSIPIGSFRKINFRHKDQGFDKIGASPPALSQFGIHVINFHIMKSDLWRHVTSKVEGRTRGV